MAVLAVHRQEPNWPQSQERPRFAVVHDGKQYWVETDGAESTVDDVVLVLEFGGASLASLRTTLAAQVDADAETARQGFIRPGAGMALT